ncbi:Lsr2 family protein [Streptomyces sp. NPDC088752]|uniref:histone-like nucleoid-structuring protein Lsr2 n=1 Tax=Streptomyces sp. NPDC088752 TaxID=3154963 RepID=UPI00341A7FE4
MAQKIITVYTDDLTGESAEEVQTHTFSLNGVNYEIDLTSDNYDKLFEALAPFIDGGRKIGRTKSAATSRKVSNTGPSADEIRSWARQNNYQVNDRGRVPAHIREAYQQAH